MASFKSYALSSKMLESLEKLNYINPTPIQEVVIPSALRGESLVARSATGSGKTHSFLIPIVDRIDINLNQVQAVIMAPTRELAKQTFDFLKELIALYGNISIRLLCAGEEKKRVIDKLQNTPQIIVATPGRLNDLILKENALDISNVKYFVIDEADMLLEMGFFEEINNLLTILKEPTIMIFSATIPLNLRHLIEKYIKAEKVFEIGEEESTNSQVTHYLIDTRHKDLKECALTFLKIKNPYLCLIFCSKKEDVDKLYKFLNQNGVKVGVLHGDLEMRQRKQMMRRIRNDEFSVIVCSDMAARGLDLDNVSDVLNIDLPNNFEFYFHRAGRTGRYKSYGNCYTFYNNDQIGSVKRIIDAGIEVQYLSLRDNELVPSKGFEKKKSNSSKQDEELNKEIKKAVAKTKSNKVKPGYKKKVKEAVEKAKRQHKRKIIKDSIRKQRVERYKQEARENKYGK